MSGGCVRRLNPERSRGWFSARILTVLASFFARTFFATLSGCWVWLLGLAAGFAVGNRTQKKARTQFGLNTIRSDTNAFQHNGIVIPETIFPNHSSRNVPLKRKVPEKRVLKKVSKNQSPGSETLAMGALRFQILITSMVQDLKFSSRLMASR